MPTSDEQAGFTLAEILVTSVVLAMVIATSMGLLLSIQRSNRYYQGEGTLKAMGQSAINAVGARIALSKKFMDNSTMGNAYRGMLVLTSPAPYPTPLASAAMRLPIIQSNQSFSPSLYGDTDTPFVPANVGNSLLMASLDSPYTCQDTVPPSPPSQYGKILNVYRFDYYYLARVNLTNGRKFFGNSFYYDLIGWHSVPLIDYTQLSVMLQGAATLAIKQAILTRLTNAGYTRAWDYSASSAATAIYTYNVVGGTLTAVASPTLPTATRESATKMSGLQGELVLGITPNLPGATAITPLAQRVPAYTSPSPYPIPTSSGLASDSFPNGFEVMIAGTTGGRRVFLRLVQASDFQSQKVYQETTSIFQGKDS